MRYLLACLVVLAACTPTEVPPHYEEMAKCITNQGVEMYGAFWCPHCARVKKDWGTAFNHLEYIECDPRGEEAQTQLCLDKNIEEYATFIRPDGERLCCEPSPEELAKFAGCEVPDG